MLWPELPFCPTPSSPWARLGSKPTGLT